MRRWILKYRGVEICRGTEMACLYFIQRRERICMEDVEFGRDYEMVPLVEVRIVKQSKMNKEVEG